MRPSELSSPTPSRPSRRSGSRALTGTSVGPLGEDILLARHGQQILRFRQIGRGQQTVATLRDGTTVSAPNRVAGGILTLSPRERLSLGWATLTCNDDPETVRELRLLGRLSAAWIIASLLLCGLMAWGLATFMDPATTEELLSLYWGVPPTGGLGSTAEVGAAGA